MKGCRAPIRRCVLKRQDHKRDAGPRAVPVLLHYLGTRIRGGPLHRQTLGKLAEEDALATLRLPWRTRPEHPLASGHVLGGQRDALAVPGLTQLLRDRRSWCRTQR